MIIDLVLAIILAIVVVFIYSLVAAFFTHLDTRYNDHTSTVILLVACAIIAYIWLTY